MIPVEPFGQNSVGSETSYSTTRKKALSMEDQLKTAKFLESDEWQSEVVLEIYLVSSIICSL